MNNLLDVMYNKRFNITNHNDEPTCYKCGRHEHVACVIRGKPNTTYEILSTGINCYGNNGTFANKKAISIHAEHNAIHKLNRQKRLHKVNIIVIRVKPFGKRNYSKPCTGCINAMKVFAINKNYRIVNIYYSNYNGNIVMEKLTEISNN
jgi:cytidine deaminase